MPFLPLFTGIRHLAHVLTVPRTKARLLCATPAGLDLYVQVHARRHLPSAVPWISEDRLLMISLFFLMILLKIRGSCISTRPFALSQDSHSYLEAPELPMECSGCGVEGLVLRHVPLKHSVRVASFRRPEILRDNVRDCNKQTHDNNQINQ